MGRTASGQRAFGDGIGRWERGRNERGWVELGRNVINPYIRRNDLRQNGGGGGRALTQFDCGAANAGALFGKTFQQFLVGVREGGGRGRKGFEKSADLSVLAVTVVVVKILAGTIKDGNDEDGTDAEVTGDGGVDSRVKLGIDGELGLTGLKTSAGEAVAGAEGDAEIGGEGSGGGAADQLIAAGEGGAAGASSFGGADYEFVKD